MTRAQGRVVATRAQVVEAELPFATVGAGVWICARDVAVGGRIAALNGGRATIAPFGALAGVALGDPVLVDPSVLALPPPTVLLGRAVDAAGTVLDGGAPLRARSLCDAVAPGERAPCRDAFATGIRAIDGPLAFARGARIGLFGAPGCGKSMLLEGIVRGASADAVVVALIGERGREAQRRIATIDCRTALICATAERPAAERVRAAEVAFAQAAALRERGLDVLLVVDSLARIAAAARELALAAGEPVGRGGYPPSTFALLARLVELAGPSRRGSVTLVATVLTDGPGDLDPVAEAVRAALDGHVVLDRGLAEAGRFPAIDVVRSASRTLGEAVSADHRRAAGLVRAAVAALERARDARSLGLDPAAGDPFLARAIAAEEAIERFLRQGDEPVPAAETLTELLRLADRIDDGRHR
jgi:ATP synthase in type III secretion protein N